MEDVLLSQLTLHQKECKIKVQICRLWESTAPFLKGDIFSLDCLLVDEEGFSMQATIRKQDAGEFKCRIIEDVIAKLSAVSEITHRYIGETLTPIRNLEIQDLYGNTLSVTLWDKFAADFDEKLISAEGTKSPVIIILAGMTVRTFKEKLHLSTCSASKIFFNLQIPEVQELMDRIDKDSDAIQRITYGEQRPIPPQEEMCENRKLIADLLNLNSDDTENVKFTCEAKIIDIDTSYGWWYKACHNCKAAVKIYDDTFWCSRCTNNEQSPIPWYKLSTIVEDRSGITNFTIFGKLAQDLIRIPAQNLAAAANSDRFVLPPIIKTIIDQTHIFQIVVDSQSFRSSTPSFKVLKIFNLYNDSRGKGRNRDNILIKCEDQPALPANKRQTPTESLEVILATPGSSSSSSRQPPTELLEGSFATPGRSSSSPHAPDKLCEFQHPKRHCLSDGEGSEDKK